MITKDNGNNYSELCAAATKILREHDPAALGGQDAPDLVDINDYFTVLGTMQRLVADKSKNIDPYFLILPGIADEEPFKINANTRAIEVPAAFKNGVAVQGDNLAEIIYFSIDRYFDTTDLYYKDVFVQWEAPAQGLGQKDTGLTMCVNKTARLIPGKVVFGWPIADSLTKQPGTLKFSVRFFDREPIDSNKPDGPKKLVYSFSTLTSSLKINPGLDFDLSDDVTYNALLEDLSTNVQGLYKDSALVSGADLKALPPIFTDYSPLTSQAWDLIDVSDGFKARALFKENDDENGIGTISYSWYSAKDGNENTTGNLISDNVKDFYTPIEEKIRYKHEIYYLKGEGDNYTIYTGSIKDGKAEDADNAPLYHKGSNYIPSKAGFYYLQATNTAGRGNFKSSKSERWEIKTAQPPIIKLRDVDLHGILREDNPITLKPEISGYDDRDKLVRSWYKSETASGEEKVLLSGEEDNKEEYETKEEGYYFLKIKNTRNNSEAVVENKEAMRVTKPAEAVSTINYLYNGKVVPSGSGGVQMKDNAILGFSCTLPKNDRMEYQWYKVDASDEERKNYTAVEGANGNSFIPTQSGIYFVEITTVWNGDKAVFNSHELKENESFNNRITVTVSNL